MKATFLIFSFSVLFTLDVQALSLEARQGKKLIAACDVCHDQLRNPPLAPPMWGVQRRYRKNSLDKEDFIQSMVNFVKAPALENAIHDEALQQLGLMPPMPLPDEMLQKIATYIYEEEFRAPCEHWQIAIARASAMGDMEHARKDERMLKKFCNGDKL